MPSVGGKGNLKGKKEFPCETRRIIIKSKQGGEFCRGSRRCIRKRRKRNFKRGERGVKRGAINAQRTRVHKRGKRKGKKHLVDRKARGPDRS